MPKTLTIICVSIALLISVVPSFGQSEGNPGSLQTAPGLNHTGSPNSNLLQSELSSAVLSPCTVVGTTTDNFNQIIYVNVNVDPPTLVNPSITGAIYWPTGVSCTTATTCTIIFSNPPPGPAQIQLTGTGGTTSSMDVSASPLVISVSDSAASTGAATWFPTGVSPNSAFQTAKVSAVGLWFSSTDNLKAGEYPTLQWQPGTITIIYQ